MNFISGQVCEKYLGFNFTEKDVYLSYVPLTHVYEQIMHIDAIMFGFCIGYSSGNQSELINDCKFLKPTIFASFPAFYNKIQYEINQELSKKSGILKSLFNFALQSKISSFVGTGNFKNAIYDSLFFGFIRNIMGGRIRFFVSGGAPLSLEVRNFLIVTFSAPIFECYGCTESAGCISSTFYNDNVGQSVGGVLPCCRM